jgi:hypothetical protein
LDAVDRRRRLCRVGGCERLHELDAVVEGDERERVGRLEVLGEEAGALLGDLELLAGHRAGTINDERDPQRRACGFVRAGHLELEHAVHGVLALDGEQLVIETNVGIHG